MAATARKYFTVSSISARDGGRLSLGAEALRAIDRLPMLDILLGATSPFDTKQKANYYDYTPGGKSFLNLGPFPIWFEEEQGPIQISRQTKPLAHINSKHFQTLSMLSPPAEGNIYELNQARSCRPHQTSQKENASGYFSKSGAPQLALQKNNPTSKAQHASWSPGFLQISP